MATFWPVVNPFRCGGGAVPGPDELYGDGAFADSFDPRHPARGRLPTRAATARDRKRVLGRHPPRAMDMMVSLPASKPMTPTCSDGFPDSEHARRRSTTRARSM